ncbi:hypothetical protein B5F53_12965 [Blautia sp. An249]|uniref:DUF5721 family protein n=1 Tax=Blautia sp. An249 TaxID=1965603 RepID=UPI000B38260C|nr:DUF5721 family protein [Blautia sp. An249]OUO77746.1 hypothetical protein B5F53_12965 [Blautia sp. An249]
MIALKILDIKDFMSRLLKGEAFDPFWLVEASITTYNTFTIDGSLHRDFFDAPLLEALDRTQRTYSLWREVKPYCFSIIRGKHTPLHFKFVFQLSRENTSLAVTDSGLLIDPEDVNGMYLNFQFHGGELTCTTGTSLRIFTMDKTIDNTWDLMVLSFFKQNGIAFEQL